jgi:hypothetical protein
LDGGIATAISQVAARDDEILIEFGKVDVDVDRDRGDITVA